MTSFHDLGLSFALCEAVKNKKWHEPSAVQQKAIPSVLEGRDVMAIAQTGSGKTGAFLLPILQKLAQEKGKSSIPLALILAPTRELALQIFENVDYFAKSVSKSGALLIGGVSPVHQIKALQSKPDILVATPGRLLDHIRQQNLSLDSIKYLVLDEADRMLDMGFWPDIKKILSHCSQKRQALLFSATLSDDIHLLSQSLLRKPVLIEINANRDATSVNQTFFQVPTSGKALFLRDLIVDNGLEQVLVFTREKASAAKLAAHLKKDGFTVDALHGDKTQAQRIRILETFKNHGLRVLVATDLASRGLDIKALPVVINYELPTDPHDYIHRIGRTGRAGSAGLAYSLVGEKDLYRFQAIGSLLKKRPDLQTPEKFKDYFENIQSREQKQRESDNQKGLQKSMHDRKSKPSRSPRKDFKKDVSDRENKSSIQKDSFEYLMPDF